MKKETMLLTGGLLGVTASAGLSLATGNIWAGFFCAVFISIIYLILLDRYMVRNLENSGYKTAVRLLVAGLVAAQLCSSITSYDQSTMQYNQLAETRSVIDEGMSKYRTQEAFLKTLKHYHRETEQNDASIASSFRKVMGNKLNADGSIRLLEPGMVDDVDFSYEIASTDSIIIIASSQVGRGENPEFVNVNMETGKYQSILTLTPKGIHYEREN